MSSFTPLPAHATAAFVDAAGAPFTVREMPMPSAGAG
jgi:NADPH:quinone reductase